MATSTIAGSRGSSQSFLSSKWTKLFIVTVGIQALVCLAFEAYVFGEFQSTLGGFTYVSSDQYPDLQSQSKTVPTFLALFIFAFVYQTFLTWDALRLKNTIQIIGLCASNVAFLVYTGLQYDQNMQAIQTLESYLVTTGQADVPNVNVWVAVRPFLIAIPVIIGVITIFLCVLAWKLYREFAWDILKHIGADYRMTKRFLHYQIYIALLKFDFFFFLGFTVQFLVIVTHKTDAEFGLTVAAVPATIAILLCAALFTQRENRLGMCTVMLFYFGGLAYFFFKLVRIYQPGYEQNYEAVRKSLTAFAVLTIVLIILTIINAFVCMNNFGAGLKAHLIKPAGRDPEKMDANSYQLQDQKPALPSRMTID